MALIGAKIRGRPRQVVYQRHETKEGPQFATELGRFAVEPMCSNMTGECVRRFGASMRSKGPDSVSQDLASGRIDRQLSLRHPPSPWMMDRRKVKRRIER